MPSSKAIKTKADSSPANYSNDVKKKLAASNRTGQACDRCRVCLIPYSSPSKQQSDVVLDSEDAMR